VSYPYKQVKHKFSAKKTERDGIKFPSKLEARYYDKLKIAQKSGDLLFFLMQVPIRLPGNTIYRVDFVEFWKDGNVKFIDVKGMPPTETFKIKKRQVEQLYPFEIIVVRKV